MIVRGIDATNDWLYGKGKNDYKKNRDAVAQCIKTRLQSFLGDCFFALEAGIDWFNYLGSKNITGLSMAVRTTILNTSGVVSLTQVDLQITTNRDLLLRYTVNTIYGQIRADDIQILEESGDALLLETGGFLTLEDGGLILL